MSTARTYLRCSLRMGRDGVHEYSALSWCTVVYFVLCDTPPNTFVIVRAKSSSRPEAFTQWMARRKIGEISGLLVWKGGADGSNLGNYLASCVLDWRAGRLIPRGRCALTRGSSPFVSAWPRSLRGVCFPVFLDLSWKAAPGRTNGTKRTGRGHDSVF